MSAIHVVVHPRPARARHLALNPLSGLLDLVVDGVNLTARLGEGQAMLFLAEFAHAVVTLSNGRRSRCTVQLQSDELAWEIGLEADREHLLLSVFRAGPSPDVAIHEREIPLVELRTALADSLRNLSSSSLPPSVENSLQTAREALQRPWPAYVHPPLSRKRCRIESRASRVLRFSAEAALRQTQIAPSGSDVALLERADLHSLLLCGDFAITTRPRTIQLKGVQLFLLAERLLLLAEDVLDAFQGARPVFRRTEVDGVRLGVRRGPGDGPVALTIGGARLGASSKSLTFPELDPGEFVHAVVTFAERLGQAFVEADTAQRQNLRLSALRKTAENLSERLIESSAEDSLTNPEPESYRCFGLPQSNRSASGRWAEGGSMRFLPRWVAAVPNIDLRATFLCGDRFVVGSAREMVGLERTTGNVIWRVAVQRAASVATPLGVVRIHPEGKIRLHDLATGDVRFSTTLAPCRSGGARGALVHTPGLPKLLVLAEGDRSVSAIDLVSGDLRWRYTGRRSASYRIRRAGRLLLVAGGESALLALDVATGDVVWRVRDRLPFSGDLAMDHDAAFAFSGGPIGPMKLHHLDLWSGELRWTRELDERPVPGQPPLITSDCVCVPTRDRRGVGMRAFSRDSGETLWEQAPGLTAPTTAWLTVDETLIANSASGTLLCIDAPTGCLRYNHVFSRQVEADQPRRLEPVLRNGALFVPQHQVHVVRPRDGEVIGTVPSDLIPDLLRVDERCDVYVAEESGHLAAFGVAPKLTLVR